MGNNSQENDKLISLIVYFLAIFDVLFEAKIHYHGKQLCNENLISLTVYFACFF